VVLTQDAKVGTLLFHFGRHKCLPTLFGNECPYFLRRFRDNISRFSNGKWHRPQVGVVDAFIGLRISLGQFRLLQVVDLATRPQLVDGEGFDVRQSPKGVSEYGFESISYCSVFTCDVIND
jgi:hypothetical protein